MSDTAARAGGSGGGPSAGPPPVLDVQDLTVHFDTDEGTVQAVDRAALRVDAGEVVGLVGESGSGKSVTALAVLGLIRPPGRVVGGRVRFEGRDLLALPEEELREVRGARISMVFQSPRTALNPVLPVGRQIERLFRIHGGASARDATARALEMLRQAGIAEPERRARQYPHQLSCGMCQRVMIAMALATSPRLLIADEPTTGLDVTTQAVIMDLVMELGRRRGMAMMLITHDLGMAAEYCNRVVVMHAGHVVETAPTAELFRRPRHPYTAKLIAATPRPGTALRALASIPGAMPNLRSVAIPPCRYSPRCERFAADCQRPLPHFGEGGRMVSCWNPL